MLAQVVARLPHLFDVAGKLLILCVLHRQERVLLRRAFFQLRRAFFQLRLLSDSIERFQKDIVDKNRHSKKPEPREDKTELADSINV